MEKPSKKNPKRKQFKKTTTILGEEAIKIIMHQQIILINGEFFVHGKEVSYSKKSLFLFDETNRVRKAAVWLIEWRWFDWFILFCIFISSLSLAIYDYSGQNNELDSVLDMIGTVLTCIFACEALIKIFAMGFVLHKKAYLRDGWNCMDFIIVITGILDLVATSFNLKSLRTLRALRPLRSINAIPSMRKLVSALINSLPDLLNVSVFLVFIIILFAILGLQQFSGTVYYKCRLTPEPVNSTYWPKSPDYTRVCAPVNQSGDYHCPLNLTCGNPIDVGISLADDGVSSDPVIQFGVSTFDNFGQAVLAVFQIITRDNWWVIMYNLQDGTPPAFAKLFCCLIIILVTYFLFNLILAVIMQAFTKIQDQEMEKEVEKQRVKEFEIEQKRLIEEEIQEEEARKHDSRQIHEEMKNIKLKSSSKQFTMEDQDINRLQMLEEEHKYDADTKPSQFRQQQSIFTEYFGGSVSPTHSNKFQNSRDEPTPTYYRPNSKDSPQRTEENFLRVPTQSQDKSPSVSVVAHSFQQRARDALKVLEYDGEVQFQQQVEKFKDDYKKAQSIKDSALRQKVTSQIKEEQDNLLKKMDFGLKQKFIETKKGNYGIDNEGDIVQSIRKSLFNSMQKKADNNKSSKKLRSMKTEIDKKTLIALKIQKSIQEKKEQQEEYDKKAGGLMNMLVNKHKLEKIMQKARAQMILNELNIRAERCCIYKCSLYIVLSSLFQSFITLCIIGNIVVLALDRYPISASETNYLEYLNLGFFLVFFIEMLLKLSGLGLRQYFKEMFNGFDCFIVVISLVDISLSYSHINAKSGSGAITALRTFRLLRVFKLAKTWKQFQFLLATIANTLKDISNFSVLLFLFIYTYTLLGMELFAYKVKFNPETNEVDLSANGEYPDSTFNTFLEAFVSVFIVLANDGWATIYFNHYRSTNPAVASTFFISLVIVGQYILLNLFISILILNFEQTSINQEARKQAHDVSNWYRFSKFFKRLRYDMYQCCSKCCCCCTRQIMPLNELEQMTEQIKLESMKQQKFHQQQKRFMEIQKNQLMASSKGESNQKDINALVVNGQLEEFDDTDAEDEEEVEVEEDTKMKSLFILPPQNKCRLTIIKLVTNNKFEYVILFWILLSCVQLALDNPLNSPTGNLAKALTYMDYISTSVFSLEATLKILAFGFLFNGRKSYLRNYWNILDFFVVCVTLSSYAMGKLGLKVIKVFRVLRVLRPLRVISRNEGLKLSLNSLVISITALINVVVIAFVFLLIFGVIGVNYFKGRYYYCYSDNLDEAIFDPLINSIATKWDCYNAGGVWINYIQKFDDIGSAMSSLFVASTTVGWAKLMYKGASATNIDEVPIHLNNPYFCFFFVAFIIVGSFFMLNLFIGVIISTYNKGKEAYGKNFLLTEKQKRWLEAKLMIIQAKPIVRMKIPASEWRHPFFFLSQSKWFDRFIYLCIILNTVVLAIYWYGQSSSVTSITSTINYVFAAVFTLEAFVKIVGYGLRYFKDGWNIFDLVIVIITMIGIILSSTINIQLGPQTTIIRSFRIGRIFKLFRKNKSLKIIFQTFIVTIPAMFNIGSLLLLFVFCFSILGMNLFADVKFGGIGDEIQSHTNFQSLSNSFLTLIRVSTGGNWNALMAAYSQSPYILYQCKVNPSYQDYVDNNSKVISSQRILDVTLGCGNDISSVIFFVAFVLFINLIYLKLFIAIILQGFQDTAEKDSRFFNSETSDFFREAWARFDPDGTSFIRVIDYPRFLLALGEPLGWDMTYLNNFEKQQEYLANVSIPARNKGKNYQFMDVLENLALLMIVNKEIEEYVKKYENERNSVEKMKQLINKEMIEAEQKVDFNQIHPGLPPPPSSSIPQQKRGSGVEEFQIKVIPQIIEPVQFDADLDDKQREGTSPNTRKRRLRKKVKKYKKVKVKKRSKAQMSQQQQLVEEEIRLLEQEQLKDQYERQADLYEQNQNKLEQEHNLQYEKQFRMEHKAEEQKKKKDDFEKKKKLSEKTNYNFDQKNQSEDESGDLTYDNIDERIKIGSRDGGIPKAREIQSQQDHRQQRMDYAKAQMGSKDSYMTYSKSGNYNEDYQMNEEKDMNEIRNAYSAISKVKRTPNERF